MRTRMLRGVIFALLAGLVLGSGVAVGQELEVLFFYDEGCPHCKQVGK